VGKFSIKGLMTKRICQPMRTYIRVESLSNLPVKNNFKRIPMSAKVHVNPKIVQPKVSPRTIRQKGV
jgi:hypothetical protein